MVIGTNIVDRRRCYIALAPALQPKIQLELLNRCKWAANAMLLLKNGFTRLANEDKKKQENQKKNPWRNFKK